MSPSHPPKWTQVPLPARAVALTSYGKQIWVCGEHQMIAVSADGGSTWQVRHFSRRSQLLFTITIAGDGTGYAWGPDGFALRSTDGGKTWHQIALAPEIIHNAHFVDGKNGLATSLQWFGITHDGQYWKSIVVPDPMAKAASPVAVRSSAMLDAAHAAVLFTPPGGKQGQMLSSTGDGGKTWNTRRFPARDHLMALTAAGGFHTAYGCVQPGTKSPCHPMRLISTDGTDWMPTSWSIGGLHSCTNAGCLVDSGRALLWNRPEEIQFPTLRYPLVWTAAGTGICTIEMHLSCLLASKLTPAEAKQPQAAPPAGPHIQEPVPISAPDPKSVYRPMLLQGTVILAIEINARGTVADLYARYSPYSALTHSALAAVRKWRFRPAMAKGHPVAVVAQVEVNFRAYGPQK